MTTNLKRAAIARARADAAAVYAGPTRTRTPRRRAPVSTLRSRAQREVLEAKSCCIARCKAQGRGHQWTARRIALIARAFDEVLDVCP